jgi:glucose-1-phosphate thymidylyltransferase
MKGLILAGGTGTRFHPVTLATNKHLLPVYDKPMIYYPLTNLILMGITQIGIVTTADDYPRYLKLLGRGEEFGVEFDFIVQESPAGLADALIKSKDFVGLDSTALILGDNFFFGRGLGRELISSFAGSGALAFGYQVENPREYGVAVFDKLGRVSDIVEKPERPLSDIAVTGLYVFDATAIERTERLPPSARGEVEITSLLAAYLAEAQLQLAKLPRGTFWSDLGRPSALLEASNFVRIIQERTGLSIGDPYEAAAVMRNR